MKEEKKLYVTYDIKKSSSAARRTRHRLGNTSTCVSIYNKVIISQSQHRYPAADADFVILYKTMETYCVSCKKNTANENSNVRKTEQHRLMFSSNYAVCAKKKLTFIKDKELCSFNNI